MFFEFSSTFHMSKLVLHFCHFFRNYEMALSASNIKLSSTNRKATLDNKFYVSCQFKSKTTFNVIFKAFVAGLYGVFSNLMLLTNAQLPPSVVNMQL